MLVRPGRLALLVFQAIWLVIILPAHTRGTVTVPGSDNARPSCCQPSTRNGKSSGKAPADDRAARCAICFFAARIAPPAVIDLSPPPHSFLHLVQWTDSSRCDQDELRLGFDTRAPPAA